MSLVARHLEANGIPTVIVGSALDIVENCGVPRFLFTDFPLGNPCGPPWRQDLQRTIAGQALDLLRECRSAAHHTAVGCCLAVRRRLAAALRARNA